MPSTSPSTPPHSPPTTITLPHLALRHCALIVCNLWCATYAVQRQVPLLPVLHRQTPTRRGVRQQLATSQQLGRADGPTGPSCAPRHPPCGRAGVRACGTAALHHSNAAPTHANPTPPLFSPFFFLLRYVEFSRIVEGLCFLGHINADVSAHVPWERRLKGPAMRYVRTARSYPAPLLCVSLAWVRGWSGAPSSDQIHGRGHDRPPRRHDDRVLGRSGSGVATNSAPQ